MGVGGHFWDLLKPYARFEGFDFLRNKRVAVDLSYWIVQHETAIKVYTRNPHLRLTLFRTINLFTKFGAYPIFVVDGMPSPLKSKARIARFFRGSGLDSSSFPVPEEDVSVERNQSFLQSVQECVELLELLGIPVVKATGEAEALCAQLNRDGFVQACITADSDAFLFGAECVIKCLKPNCKEPFECYHLSEIEDGLELKRKHLIAIALLVGNDHDLNGVQGIGIDTALRFVKTFSESEILNRLQEIGRGDSLTLHQDISSVGDPVCSLDENLRQTKVPHCTFCGHPGSKRSHLELACEYCCSVDGYGCKQKSLGFKCTCSSCILDRRNNEQKKNDIWLIKVCAKISMEQNFPNVEIIDMYLGNKSVNIAGDGLNVSWKFPNTEILVDYLAYHLHWQPPHTRQRLLPMLSTIFLREMASNRTNDLLYGQFEFDSIQRVKTILGHRSYVVKWKRAGSTMTDSACKTTLNDIHIQEEPSEVDLIDVLDEPNIPQLRNDHGSFLLTDEDRELVLAAFPEKVNQYLEEMRLKEMKSKGKRSCSTPDQTTENSASPRSKQFSITEFYRSSKGLSPAKTKEMPKKDFDCPNEKRKSSTLTSNLSKSARRRLLFS